MPISSSYPLSYLAEYNPYPVHCKSGFDDGFSGWYAVSDPDDCVDFCFWEVYASPSSSSSSSSSASSAVGQEQGGVDAPAWAQPPPSPEDGRRVYAPADLRCALDMNAECPREDYSRPPAAVTTDASGNVELSDDDYYGGNRNNNSSSASSSAFYDGDGNLLAFRYTASNTADPHRTTTVPGVAEWRCALNAGGDNVRWSDLAPDSRLTAPGYFGPTFQYLRCGRGSNEVLSNTGSVVANSMAFWGCMLALCLCGLIGMSAWLWVWTKRRKRRALEATKSGNASKAEGGGSTAAKSALGEKSGSVKGAEEGGDAGASSSSSVVQPPGTQAEADADVEADVEGGTAAKDEITNEGDSTAVDDVEAGSKPGDEPPGTEAEPDDAEAGAADTETATKDEMANEGGSTAIDVESKPCDEDDAINAVHTSTSTSEPPPPFSDPQKTRCECCQRKRCLCCRQCCKVATLVITAILLLVGLVLSLMSVIELRGNTLYADGPSKLTPKCVDPALVCPAGNVDIDRPSQSYQDGGGDDGEESAAQPPFSYLVASDAQLNWWDGESATLGQANVPVPCDEASDSCSSCTSKFATYTNGLMKSAIERHLRGASPADVAAAADSDSNSTALTVTPSTLIMNGDLTAYFHPDQRSSYQSYYHSVAGLRHYFPALGNHDYAQGGARYGSDQWFGPAKCNKAHAIGYMRGAFCGGVPRFDPSRVVRFDSRSLAYSWEEGRYHFVHVHYYPSYETATVGLRSSVTWLDGDLSAAFEANLTSVLFVHAAGGLPVAAENAVLGKNVKAIFAGHSHRCFMRKCFFLRALKVKEVFPNRTTDDLVASPPSEEEIAATSPPSWSDKCVPGNYALCGGRFSGGSGMNLYFLANRSDDAPPLPDTELYYEASIRAGRESCAPPEPVFINATDNTLLCAGRRVTESYFPPAGGSNDTASNGGERIPQFWSGSASFETYLKADFYDDRIVINGMTASEGATRGGGRYVDNFPVPNAVYPYHSEADVEETTIWLFR